MLVVGWSFTSQCNLRCIHCYNASGKPHPNELTHEQALFVAKKLIDSKVDAVNFGGGECPLRKDFFEICRLLHEAGIKLSLTTNGLTYKKVAPYIHLFHDIGVSIDFADAERHDFFRGVKGAFEKTIEATKFFVSKGVNTEIVTCITKLNCTEKELRKLYELAKELKVDFWRLNRYRPIGRKGHKDKLRLEPEDLKKAYSFLANLAKDFVMPDPLFALLEKKTSICPCGTTSFRIQPDGEVSPCIYLKLSGGNILKNSIEEIMNSPVFRAIRNRDFRGTKCEHCPIKDKCGGGCAGAAYAEHGSFNQADPLCWINPKWNVHEKYLCTAYVPIKNET
ncbi:hypothetical protein AYK26_06665 [Euryarchaeota archaeon SM23-78]|nr:MAG: hypothetical protein AYK26_06665 [Euryarchaeota archaeon SM23-78]